MMVLTSVGMAYQGSRKRAQPSKPILKSFGIHINNLVFGALVIMVFTIIVMLYDDLSEESKAVWSNALLLG
jgi:uncharacterized membrane protein YvlD (DUF360 family)